jgi:DNA-directed RNA polymerase subunit RPC12/RpoP
MPEEKPGPCACDKVSKGYYCADCKKDLEEKELKAGACPTCEKKALKTDYCSKTVAGQKIPDRARVTYECAGCGEKAEFEADFKHKDDCKKKTSTLKKVCSKSGTAPHVTPPKD